MNLIFLNFKYNKQYILNILLINQFQKFNY